MLQIVLPTILEAFRRVQGLTQEAAAELMGVSTVTFHRWEKGKCAPHVTQIEGLARGLGQTLEEFGTTIGEALRDHFATERAENGDDEAVATGVFLDAVCTELHRATTNLEALACRARASGDAALVARLWASSNEARSVLDRVHVMLLAAVTGEPYGDSDQE